MAARIRSELADRLGVHGDALKEIRKIFDEIDSDGNKVLSFREFRKAVKELEVCYRCYTTSHIVSLTLFIAACLSSVLLVKRLIS